MTIDELRTYHIHVRITDGAWRESHADECSALTATAVRAMLDGILAGCNHAADCINVVEVTDDVFAAELLVDDGDDVDYVASELDDSLACTEYTVTEIDAPKPTVEVSFDNGLTSLDAEAVERAEWTPAMEAMWIAEEEAGRFDGALPQNAAMTDSTVYEARTARERCIAYLRHPCAVTIVIG